LPEFEQCDVKIWWDFRWWKSIELDMRDNWTGISTIWSVCFFLGCRAWHEADFDVCWLYTCHFPFFLVGDLNFCRATGGWTQKADGHHVVNRKPDNCQSCLFANLMMHISLAQPAKHIVFTWDQSRIGMKCVGRFPHEVSSAATMVTWLE
jgi:hypothetical protein